MNATVILIILFLLPLFVWLLIYFLCTYAKVYATDSKGDRMFVGYLWKRGAGYKLYEGIPFLLAKRIGYIKNDRHVYLQIMNKQHNYIETDHGEANPQNGEVRDCNGTLMGTCESLESRSSAVLNNGMETAFVRCGFRHSPELIAYAGAAGALYCEAYEGEDIYREDVRVGYADLALPAALIFTILFIPLGMLGYNNEIMSFIGAELSYIGYMFLAYEFIHFVLYVIKHMLTMRNKSMVFILGLVDHNVGMTFLNIVAITIALAGIIVSVFVTGYTLAPLFVVLFTGLTVNLQCFKSPWNLLEPCDSWGRNRTANNSSTSVQVKQGAVERCFSWAKILEGKGIAHQNEEVSVFLNEADLKDLGSRIRVKNPFKGCPGVTEEQLVNYTRIVLQGSDDAPNSDEKDALLEIVNSAYMLCRKYNLADFELYDLLLQFCQYNIEYKEDGNSVPIGKPGEYFRFPAETLYDVEGDCDCKSVLAHSLFKLLGVEAYIASICKKGKTEASHSGVVLRKSSSAIVSLPPRYVEYKKGFVYCETTGEGFNPGNIPNGYDSNSIELINDETV